MKRKFLLNLLVLMALCLSACGCRHEWKAATCEAPRTCLGCGATEGEILPHVPGDWAIAESDYVNAENYLVRQCTGCGAVMEEYTSHMDRIHNTIGFLPSAQEFADRLAAQLERLKEENVTYKAEIVNEDGKVQLNIHYTEFGFRETAAELTFGIGGDELDYDRKDDRNRYLAVGGIAGGAEHLAIVMPALILAADPEMDIPGAFALAEAWISYRSVQQGGLSYDIAASSEAAVVLMIRVDS